MAAGWVQNRQALNEVLSGHKAYLRVPTGVGWTPIRTTHKVARGWAAAVWGQDCVVLAVRKEETFTWGPEVENTGTRRWVELWAEHPDDVRSALLDECRQAEGMPA